MEAAQAVAVRREEAPKPMPRLMTIRQFADRHIAFSEARLRNLIFASVRRGQLEANGLGDALVRIGRRVYIDEEKFFSWVAAQGQAG